MFSVESQKELILSVMMPAFNEGAHIYANILRVCETLKGIDFELIVVDDGSADNTFAETKRARDGGYPVIAVQQEVNRGKGAALFRGFGFATAKQIAFLDADLFEDSFLVRPRGRKAERQDNQCRKNSHGPFSRSDKIKHDDAPLSMCS